MQNFQKIFSSVCEPASHQLTSSLCHVTVIEFIEVPNLKDGGHTLIINSMFSTATKLLIGTYSCPLKLGASFGRLREGTYCIIGLLYRREFSTTSGINCKSFMEDTQQSRAGTALAAVCQMNSTSDVDRNLGICEDLVRKAKSRGAKVCLRSTV